MDASQITLATSAGPSAATTQVPPSITPSIVNSSASATPLAGSGIRPASAGSPTGAPLPPRVSTTATASLPAPAVPALPTQTNSTQPQLQRKKSILSRLWALKASLYAAVTVALVDGLSLSAPSTKSPLGSISYQNGVLVLSILAMLTGYSLAAAAQTAWDIARYRKLSKTERGQSLLVFWTLCTDVEGSCLILWREFCQLFRHEPRANNRSMGQQNRRNGSRGHPKFWSTLRIISWAIMQFPGVIIMTIVNSTTSYVPVRWIPVSGGIGIYDFKLATPATDPILVLNSALNILQDSRRAVQVDPVNSDCIKAGDSCKSFIIPGGLDTVAPWPFQNLKDGTLDVYVTRGAPAYQIDFWSPPDNITIANDACSTYAASEDTGLQLCVSEYAGKTGQLVAGWTPCTATVLPSGECSQPGSWGAYVFTSTILSVSRRTATVYMSRDTGTIVALEDLGKSELQTITVADFKTAFDVMIIPWSNSSAVTIPSTDYTWQLTAQIATTLYFDLAAPESSRSLDYLHNLFATPLFVFNPVTLGPGPDIDTVQPSLLPENYVNGSYARTRIHAVPQRWTVFTYVGVSGLLLLLIFLVLAFGAGCEGPEPSVFPFIDCLHLKWVIQEDEEKEVEDISQAFQATDLGDNEKILEKASRVRVKLRTNGPSTTTV